ncbi:MAG: VOC family protein [Rhodobacterales bacterium]
MTESRNDTGPMITFDHIAIAAPSLAAGADYMRNLTGLTFPKGGAHPDMATHNLVTALGPDSFAEVIAINPDATPPNRPRWFGLDDPAEHAKFPRLQAWLLRTDDIDGCITRAAKLGIDLGTATPFRRDALRWRFAVTDDGKIPLDGAAPLLLQWDTAAPHPAANMADLGLRMDALSIETPQADRLNDLLNALGLQTRPDIIQAAGTKLTAQLSTPNGKATL